MRPNEYNELIKKIRCSDDFRSRMQEKLSSEPVDAAEYEDSVSGTEVITARHRWGKFAAMAAAFVLVCGAVGGGVYHFANMKDNTDIEHDIDKNRSIYSSLREKKDKFYGDITVKENDVYNCRSTGQDMEPFFEYMDKFNTDNEIEKGDFNETSRSITINFYEKENDKKLAETVNNKANADGDAEAIKLYDEACFIFTLYDNGCYSMTENEENRTTYHCFTDGEKVFNDFLNMLLSSDVLENFNSVSKEEMEEFFESGFANDNDGKVYFYPDGADDPVECTVVDREGFKKELMQFEWKRATELNGDVDFYYLGFTININGDLQVYIDGAERDYTLKNYSDIEKFRSVLSKHFEIKGSVDLEHLKDVFKKYSSTKAAQWVEGPMGDPQGKHCYDTVSRYYNVNDTNGFIDEITSLDWVFSSTSEIESKTGYREEGGYYISNGFYEFGFLDNSYGEVSIYLDGYMKVEKTGCYKLKNEKDVEKLTQICDKYFEMDENSKLAEKISKGVKNFNNLHAKFTYESGLESDETKHESISGYINLDAKNEIMYMAGEGKAAYYDEPQIVEIMMYGHDTSAFRITDKEKETITDAGTYRYSNGYASPPPEYNYFYICKDIENMLAPRYMREYNSNDYQLESREVNGNIEITVNWLNSGFVNDSANIILSPNGQLIAYEIGYNGFKESFRLDDYVFDSSDFVMEDPGTIFDSMKADAEAR